MADEDLGATVSTAMVLIWLTYYVLNEIDALDKLYHPIYFWYFYMALQSASG